MKNLLQRTNFKGSVKELKKILFKIYPFLGILDIKPISEGYEDANFFITNGRNKYVLKIFSKDRKVKNIKDYVRVILEAEKIGVKTMRLVPGIKGFLERYEKDHFMLSEFIEGINFINITPTHQDIEAITLELAKLNSLNFPIKESYDGWGNNNFIREHDLHSKELTVSQAALIESIYEQIKNLNLTGFSKGVIHGDMQRKHVLKDSNKYFIIDFGCARNDYLVYEISTFLAWFCLNDKDFLEYKNLKDIVISTYTKFHPLNDQELNSIDLLIKASYAAYYLQTCLLINNGDDSRETLEWNKQASEMLNLL